MNFKGMIPAAIEEDPACSMQVLLRNILVRSNFVPAIRHSIGWRGLKNVVGSVEAWTAKVRGREGVYGIFYLDVEHKDEWITGHFGLNYFPGAEEETVELYSVHAGLIAVDSVYMDMVRNFISHEHLCDLFNIGIIDISVNMNEESLCIGVHSVSEQRVISQNGVYVLKEGVKAEAVPPGGVDQALPAYDLSFDFYEVLASSFTLHCGEPPTSMQRIRYQGQERRYDEAGLSALERAPDIFGICLNLCYGKASPPAQSNIYDRNEANAVDEIIWRGDGNPPLYGEALWWKAHMADDMKSLDKSLLGIDERPALIVVTGFLGSGKTSFLQHFIEYQVQMNRFVAIVQNEIGEEGLDGKLLDHDYSVVEIDEGCICCTLVGNLKVAIQQIMESFQPDYIIVETTGLANPMNLIDEVVALEEMVRFDSVTTVVDGEHAIGSMHEYKVAAEQIAAADIILLNKTDLLSAAQKEEVELKVRSINKHAPIFPVVQGNINPAMLFDVDEKKDSPVFNKNAHSCHERHHDHRSDGLSSVKVDLPVSVDKAVFLNSIEALNGSVFRIKGVVEFTGDPLPRLFQYVSGRYEISLYPKETCDEKFLIFIGREMEHSHLLDKQIDIITAGSASS